MDETEVVVVGAGLAGLQCARELVAAGRTVQVWESAGRVGGRIVTDRVDGFLVDRGFQVLNPAYPAVKRWVDADALRLQAFGAGISARLEDRSVVLAHPLREPKLLPKTLRSGLVRPADVVRLARWAGPALARRPAQRDPAQDVSVASSLDRVGLRGQLREVIEAFLAGVVLEDDGSSSYDFVLLLLRMFALGVPGLPERGMQSFPEQLATGLDVRLSHAVEDLDENADSVVVRGPAGEVAARHVVVATDGWAAERLAGVTAPPAKGVLTLWYTLPAGDAAPTDLPVIHVDARASRGPFTNTAVISAAAPSYAPTGRHLVSASALIDADGTSPADHDVRRQAGEVLGANTSRWELVARHEVPHALPAQPAPLVQRRSLEVGPAPAVLVCGDHRDTASIQGALVSGHRAAAHLLR